MKLHIIGLVFGLMGSMLCAQVFWQPTASFPSPGAIQAYCLGEDNGWNSIVVGGCATTGNYPLFVTMDQGSTWTNIGPTPAGVVYAITQEPATLGTKYVALRWEDNSAINGIYKKTSSTNWTRVACAGLDVRDVCTRYNNIVFAGVRGNSKGIYLSTNDGDTFTNVMGQADIYGFDVWRPVNTTDWIVYAIGCLPSGDGILYKSNFPNHTTWTTVATFSHCVLNISVSPDHTIYVATSDGNLYKSSNQSDFSLIRQNVAFNDLHIPIVATGQNYLLYSDWITGVYYSMNAGASWSSLNSGIEGLNISDIAVNSVSQLVYLVKGGSLSSFAYKSRYPIQLPPIPVLNSPQNSENVSSNQLVFDWNDQTSVEEYVIEVSSNSGFTNIVYSNVTASSQHSLDISSFTNGSYFWRVKAENAFGESTWSVASSFNYQNVSNDDQINEVYQNYFHIYPNPSTGEINLQYLKEVAVTANVQIYDIRGRLQYSNCVAFDANQLEKVIFLRQYDNDSSFATGLYFIRVSTGKHSEIIKALVIK